MYRLLLTPSGNDYFTSFILFTEVILHEVREVETDFGRLQNARPLVRARKARWIRQDRRINLWLEQLVDGRKTMTEFLMAAQNVTRTLEIRGIEVLHEDPPEYPARLPLVADLPHPGNLLNLFLKDVSVVAILSPV